MEVFTLYALSTSAWLSLQATPLLLTPRFILSLTTSDPRRITDLESYLCRTLGLALLVLAALLLILTNTIPVASAPSGSSDSSSTSSANEAPATPYAYPALLVTTVYHALTSFLLYTQTARGFNFAFSAGLVGSSALFCVGVWALVFGGDKKHLSKKTGADKRTSGFPFENNTSARQVKKEGKEREKEKEGKTGRRSVARRNTGGGRD